MEESGTTKRKQVSTTAEPGSRDDLTGLAEEELHHLLNEVLEQEDYMRAIAIRDELQKRKK